MPGCGGGTACQARRFKGRVSIGACSIDSAKTIYSDRYWECNVDLSARCMDESACATVVFRQMIARGVQMAVVALLRVESPCRAALSLFAQLAAERPARSNI